MGNTYIKQIVEQVNLVTENCGPLLLYGENIDTGSCLSGLTRGVKVNAEGRILNVGNCELTHIGMGLGMMMDGGNAVIFMKQLDFLLLALDQIVNTFNSIRAFSEKKAMGSFTIVTIVCDQGFQGSQSSLNAASDFASLANIDVFCLNGIEDTSCVIETQLVKPGFRVLCVSQHLSSMLAIDISIQKYLSGHAAFQYRRGNGITIVCYNFSLQIGIKLANDLQVLGIQSDLFQVNFIPNMDLSLLIGSCVKTGKLIVIDDSKTITKFGDILVAALVKCRKLCSVHTINRCGCADEEYGVRSDQMEINFDAAIAFAKP